MPVPALLQGTSNCLLDYFTTTVVSNNLKHEFHPGMHAGIVQALAKQRWTKNNIRVKWCIYRQVMQVLIINLQFQLSQCDVWFFVLLSWASLELLLLAVVVCCCLLLLFAVADAVVLVLAKVAIGMFIEWMNRSVLHFYFTRCSLF